MKNTIKSRFSLKEYLNLSLQKVNEIDNQTNVLPSNTWITLTDTDKLKFGNILIELVCKAYERTEKGSQIKNQQNVDASQWQILSINGDGIINCAIFYRGPRSNEPWQGNKIQGFGHDGTKNSKMILLNHVIDLMSKDGWWCEARGAAASAYTRLGLLPVTNKKIITSLFPNTNLTLVDHNKGIYTRTIRGEKMSEQIFGHPVLKNQIKKYNIKEYIQLLESEWDDIKTIIPNSIIRPSDHLIERAELRGISVDRIKQAILNVVNEHKRELMNINDSVPFTLVDSDVDVGMVKSFNQLYRGTKKDIFTILTVHENIHKIPGYREYISSNAKNKMRRVSPAHIKSFEDFDYDDKLGSVQRLKIGNNIYSFTLRHLEELTKNQTPTEYNVNTLYNQAYKEIYKTSKSNTSKLIRYAKLKDPVYVIKHNGNWIIVYNPYSILRVFENFGKEGKIQVKFLTMKQLSEFNNAKNTNDKQISEEIKKLKKFFNEKENRLNEVSKVIIDYDPNNLGAYVRSTGDKHEPTVMIPFNKLNILEPESKMDKSESSKKLKELIKVLKTGEKLAPILVRKLNGRYQILDGHHRYAAYKNMKIKSIPARIIDPKNIKIFPNKKKV